MSFQRKAVEVFHSRQAAIEAQSHADKVLPHAQALPSSATDNGSCSNTTAAVETMDTDGGGDMVHMDDVGEQAKPSSQRTSVLISFATFLRLIIVIAKNILVRSSTASSLQTKRLASIITNGDLEDEDIRRKFSNMPSIIILIIVVAKKKHSLLGNPGAVNKDGLLLDIDVQDLQVTNKDLPTREDKRHDVDNFFHAPVEKEIGGRKRKLCICKLSP